MARIMSVDAGQARTWFVKVDGRVYGPYTSPQMRGYVSEGRVADYTLVSVERDGTWKPAADVEILASWIEDSRKVSQAAAETEDPANLLVITEVNSGVGEAVASVLRRYGDAVDIVPGVWLVRARTTASALRNDLSHLLDREDKLFVVDASRDRSAWFNFASDADAKVRELWRGGNAD
jgi:GYF domain 2